MKLGLLTKHDSIARAIWMQLPAIAKWALLAKRGGPELVTLGDLR